MYRVALISLLFLFYGCQAGGPTELICGGGSDFQCPSQMFCELGPECGNLDRSGVCRIRPLDCPVTPDEVCGCDGKEYLNRCIANSTGMTVKYKGHCK